MACYAESVWFMGEIKKEPKLFPKDQFLSDGPGELAL